MDILKKAEGLAVTIVGAVIAEEFKQRSPLVAAWMVRKAVCRLPSEERERYSEEWHAHLVDTPGNLSKLLAGIGFFTAAAKIADTSEHSNRRVGKAKPARKSKSADLKVALPLYLDSARKEDRRILVVDDEPVIASTLAIILEQVGFKAKAAYSGEEAVAMAAQFKPNILISDVVMTGISGVDAGVQIKALLPGCRIMLFGGQAATRELVQRAAKDGHRFEVLNKPVHPAELLAKLNPKQSDGSSESPTSVG